MKRVFVAVLLVVSFFVYTGFIYTNGTETGIFLSASEQTAVAKGKALFQKHNCGSCHQLYGLGGYLGPDLTTAYSDKTRGENYLRALLKSGGNRMPDFHFSEAEITQLIFYLRYVDSTAKPPQTVR